MSSILDELGLSSSDIDWHEFAACQGVPVNYFFDWYESSPRTAQSVTDPMCLSCPVMKQCLQEGIEQGESGVRGGIYLTNGKKDKARNAHKTTEVWKRIEERLSDSSQ